MKKIPLLLSFCLFFFCWVGSLHAQPANAVDSLRAAFDTFILDYQQLIDTHKTEKVLQHFSPELRTTVISSDIKGRVRVIRNDYAQFSEFLGRLAFSPGLRLDYQVSEVLKVEAKTRFGFVVYNVNYELNQEGSVWNRGNETVTVSFEKKGGQWKIVHFTTVIFEDEKLRGRCFCKIYAPKEAAEANEYLAMMLVPAGESYMEKSYNIRFRDGEAERVINAGDREFRWRYSNGEVWQLSQSGIKQKLLGTAKLRQEAIIVVLRDYFHQDNCSSLTIKK
ncbi:MAG: hypothetical protein ACFCUI_02590 [Bernardetiaceae bacterium]